MELGRTDFNKKYEHPAPILRLFELFNLPEMVTNKKERDLRVRIARPSRAKRVAPVYYVKLERGRHFFQRAHQAKCCENERLALKFISIFFAPFNGQYKYFSVCASAIYNTNTTPANTKNIVSPLKFFNIKILGFPIG